jgi:hypothetical protein
MGVTWTNKKQQVISLSSMEVEYQGTVKAGCRQFGFIGCFLTSICLRKALHPYFATIKGSLNLKKKI